MEREKLAVIALVAIIVIGFSAYILINEDILDNFSSDDEQQSSGGKIETGDCADVNYIGKYENGTVFDTSYEETAKEWDLYDETRDYAPLNVFITLDKTASPPEGYDTYSSGLITGFMEGLIGLKEGQTSTIGPIPPEKAYGTIPKEGDEFTISTGAQDMTIQIREIKEDQPMPEDFIQEYGDINTTLYRIRYDLFDVGDETTLYSTWINATIVTKINETTVWMYTTPPDDLMTDFTWVDTSDVYTSTTYPEETSSVTTLNDTTIIVTHTPEIGDVIVSDAYTSFGYHSTEYTVLSVTDEKINTSYLIDPEDPVNISYQEFDRTTTIERNQTQEISQEFPEDYFGSFLDQIKAYYLPDLTISLSDKAGKTLYFEVTIEKVYKTS